MRTKIQDTTEQLEVVLATLEQPELAEDLRNSFFLLDPLAYARLLYSLSLPDEAYAALLALKVDAPPQYHGADISPLIDRAMEILWSRLAEAADTIGATI